MLDTLTHKGLFTIFISVVIVWTVMLVSSVYWNYHNEEENVKTLALKVVKSNIKKDRRFSQWAAGHGGVYVPVSETAQPNPYLSNLPHREIVGDNNKTYTLIHPAHMLRIIMHDYKGVYGVRGSLTSLKVLNPDNEASEWERKALMKFEDKTYDQDDYYEYLMGDKPVLKYMRALKVKKNCLKCHAQQGYKVGDNRGGMSVTLPLEELYSEAGDKLNTIVWWHVLIWLFMMIFLLIVYITMNRNLHKLENLNRSLEQKVADRTQELERSNEKLKELSSTDYLTKAPNRRYFYEVGEKYFNLAKREGSSISVLMMDIDFFKQINDTYGHQAGDEILVNVSSTMKEILRKSDIFGRVGGEEFAILAKEENSEDALIIAEKIRNSIQAIEFVFDEKTIHITISIGIAEIQPKDARLDDIIKRADVALYMAKEDGRNCTKVFHP